MAENKEHHGHAEEPVSLMCTVLTPQKKVFAGQGESVYLPAAQGDLEIQPRREPLLTPLKSGIAKLRTLTGDGAVEEQTLAVHGGFLDMNGIEVTIFATAAEAATELLGAAKVHLDETPRMGSEDFADMLQQAPGAYVWLTGDVSAPLHNPSVVFDDKILPVGAALLARIAEKRARAG